MNEEPGRPATDEAGRSALIEAGRACHRRGDLEGAERLYRSVLERSPDDGAALHLMGVLALQRGRPEEGARRIGEALAIRPSAAAWADLGAALNALARHSEAESACRRALALDPRSADAHHNLGLALRGLGRFRSAVEALQAVLRLDPGRTGVRIPLAAARLEGADPAGALDALRGLAASEDGLAIVHFLRGNALYGLSRPEEAERAYRRALQIEPGFGSAQENLGAALRTLGRTAEAVAAYRAAHHADPTRIGPLVMLAGLLVEERAYDAAAEAARTGLLLDPGRYELRLSLGAALAAGGDPKEARDVLEGVATERPDQRPPLIYLGMALRRLGAFEDAVAACRRAAAILPRSPGALGALGAALKDAGRSEEAVEVLSAALDGHPAPAEVYTNRGAARVDAGDLPEGLCDLERAIALDGKNAEAWCNLAVARYRSGDLAGALGAYETGLGFSDTPNHRWGYGLALLKAGRFAEGWRAFEERLRTPKGAALVRPRNAPYWRGAPLGEGTLLIEAEQGAGDAIQCLRYLPHAARRAGKLILRVPPSLRSLCLRIPGVAAVVDEPAPGIDAYCSLFSLPGVFGADFGAIPEPPYLTADPALVERWRARLPVDGLKVGIVWQGNPAASVERGRSVPLKAFAPLFSLQGVRLVSLQKEHGLDQMKDVPQGALSRLGEAYARGDYHETAAVILGLDLVIACDTSVAHLAGALGRPVWLLVNAVADWRWLEGRADSPWYPSMRLYRAPDWGNWDATMNQIAADLSSRRFRP